VGGFRKSVQLQNLGVAQDATVLQILYSLPFMAKYGNTSDMSNSDYVTFMYNQLLGRLPTPLELRTWDSLLAPAGNSRSI